MTTRQLTQEEIDKAPEWSTHYQIYDDDKDICFESEDFYQFVLNGVRKDNIIGLEDESLPIPGREATTTTTTKVIEFKEGETVNLRSLRKYEAIGIDLKGGYLESYKSETGVLSATFTKDCTITIEVK